MSGFYIGVDGKARKVKGGYIGIDGKARKIKKGYIGDANGVARLCWISSPFDPVFANNTWEEIALACKTRQVPDTWSVGDQKTMTIDGKSYAINIIGKEHDDYSDGSGKAPLTFQFLHSYNAAGNINNDTFRSSWKDSAMRTTDIPQIKSKMPAEVGTAIKKVKKRCSSDGSSTMTNVAEELFLLSEVEIFGQNTNSFSGEGTQYAYYANGGSKKKKWSGSNHAWWTRSVYAQNYFCFVGVTSNGTSDYFGVTEGLGISPAFCF